jgi:hypothetical protein
MERRMKLGKKEEEEEEVVCFKIGLVYACHY